MTRIELDAASVEVALADGAQRTLLHPTTLTLTEHRVGIIGANGSGKSTLARLFNGLASPTSGSVRVGGHDVSKDAASVRRLVGFCFTDPAAQLVMPTCVEDIELSLRRTVKDAKERRTQAMQILADIGLENHAHDSVFGLSGGQRQLLALAGVLSISPAIVVADEPTTLLDLANTRMIADRLFSLEQQLVLVTHDLELAARCERVLVVADGAIRFDGAPVEAVADYLTWVDSVSRPGQ